MIQPRARLLVLIFAGLTAACAGGPAGLAQTSVPSPAVERGLRIAQRNCATCHSIYLNGESRRPNAPAFRDMRIRYNDISFERAMDAIASGGHNEMPPLRLERDQIHDVAAYIESLGPPRV